MKRVFLTALLSTGCAAIVSSGCSPGKAPTAKTMEIPVLSAQVMATNVPVEIEPPPFGHVLPLATVTIRPQVGGLIQKVNFAEGQEVKKGDLLFTIDPRPSQAAMDAAQAALTRDLAQLENAKIQYEREQKLYDQKLVSQEEFDTNKAAYDAMAGTVQSDRAALTNAALNVEFTTIRAPLAGRTGSLQFHEGNVVKAPDDTLLTINQMHPIYAVFAVPEKYLPEINRQMRSHVLKVSARIDNSTTLETGELTFVDNSVDTTTGTIQLKATFGNASNALWPGQFVQIDLTLYELTNAVVIPSQAVQTGQTNEFVYVVKDDSTVAPQPVKTGVTYQGLTVIVSGLQAGETVVTDGQLRLAPGAKVSQKNQTTSTNAP